MRTYGISITGQYHIDDGSNVCQDAYAVGKVIDDGETILIAAVADGVGSERYSQIGSSAAAEQCVRYCVENYIRVPDKISLLSNSFTSALTAIMNRSSAYNIPADQMHTTLCAVIMTKDRLYVGNVGDSGAIGLGKDGRYVKLTKQQNDSYGCVYPLHLSDCWDFYMVDGEFVSVLLMTDGFLNYIAPRYLSQMDDCQGIDYDIIKGYMDPEIIGRHLSESDLERCARNELSKIPRIYDEGIVDDITIVGLFSDIGHDDYPLYMTPIDRAWHRERYLSGISAVTNTGTVEGPNMNNVSVQPLVTLMTGSDAESITVQIGDSNAVDLCRIRSSKMDDVTARYSDGERTAIIFKRNYRTGLEEKAKSMLSMRYTDNLRFFGWPTSLIYQNGTFVGYTVNGAATDMSITDIYNKERSVPKRAQIALNLSMAMNYFHSMDCAVGDICEDDVCILENGKVLFNNISSYHLPPEVMPDESDLDEGISTDLENLTEWIYKLLFQYIASSDEEPDSEMLVRTIDLYGGLFPDYLIGPFIDTYLNYDEAPEAYIWVNILKRYSSELRQCTVDKGHIYHKDIQECPYCKMIRQERC